EYGVPNVTRAGRGLPMDARDRVVSTVERWIATGSSVFIPGFARSVPESEIVALGDLTPWSYV
ncbi:MAG: hypothetical protein ACLUYK_05070, partial [Eggerthella lenta]